MDEKKWPGGLKLLPKHKLIDPFKTLLARIYLQIEQDQLDALKFLLEGSIPISILEKCHGPRQLFSCMIQNSLLGEDNLDILEKFLEEVQISDLAERVRVFKCSREVDCELPGLSVPPEIQNLGPRAEAAYQKALQNGSVQVYRGRIMLLGQARAGKTSLKKSLLGIPFDPREESTEGVEVEPSKCEVEVNQVKNWQCTKEKKLDVSEFKEDIAEMIARDLKEPEDKDQITTDGLDLEQVAGKGLEESDASPVNQPADQDIQSKTAVVPNDSLEVVMHGSRSGSMPADPDNTLGIDTTEVLPRDVMEKVVKYLQGLKLESNIQAKEISLSVWDFAGQHLYYASHSVFLSLRAVYVLVHNLSTDLSAQAEPCARQGTLDVILENPANQTNLDNLLSWLVSVHCIRPTADQPCRFFGDPERNQPYLRPPVLIVGTHADEPFGAIIEMEKCIKKSILGKTYEKHVVRPFYAVDNTRSLSDYGVQALQNKIMEVLNQEPYMGEKVPIRWFQFEKVIEALVEKKTYHMNLDQLLKVTKQVCRIDDEEELSTMLNFYQDLGVIVKHGRTVVLDAQWLIDLFKQLITVRPFDEVNPLYSKCWQKLEDCGILSMALVDHVFADFIQKGLSKQDILDMMELYGLIAKFSFLQADGEPGQTYFVPAQLRSSPSVLYEIKPADCDPCPLYLYFPDGFVPHGLFSQLLARCIKWCSGCSPKTAPNLYRNGARFLIGRQTTFQLILICRKAFIKVILKRNPASPPPTTASATMACDVRAFFEDTLQVMSCELSWLRNVKYKLCVACAPCLNRTDPCDKHRSVSCTHDDCLCLLPLCPEEQMSCPHYFGDEPIAPVGLEQWLLVHKTESSEKQEMVSSNSERSSIKRRRELTSCYSAKRRKYLAVKEGTPKDDDLQGLAKEIVAEWKELGRRLLESDEAKLYAIHKENEQYSEKAYKMLLKWKQTQGSGATFLVLHDALCHSLVNRKDLAERFCLVEHD